MSEFLLSHFSKIFVFGCDQEAIQYFRILLKPQESTVFIETFSKNQKLSKSVHGGKSYSLPKLMIFREKSMVDRKYSYVQIQLNFNLFAASIVVSVALEI